MKVLSKEEEGKVAPSSLTTPMRAQRKRRSEKSSSCAPTRGNRETNMYMSRFTIKILRPLMETV